MRIELLFERYSEFFENNGARVAWRRQIEVYSSIARFRNLANTNTISDREQREIEKERYLPVRTSMCVIAARKIDDLRAIYDLIVT